MRKILLLPMCALLAACVDDSASYYINGADHSLSVRRQQKYFWDDSVTLALVASRWPDCVRRHRLALVPARAVNLELFGATDQRWNLRQGTRIWQAETATCNGMTVLDRPPEGGLGQRLGVFKVQDKKLVYQADPSAPAPQNLR
jgi:hypothetical protein